MAVHEASSAELDELASAFALEALLPEEAESYVRHLEGCGLCRRLVIECQTAADLLPLALEEGRASAGLKQRILAQAAQELERETATPARVREPERRRWGIRWSSLMSLIWTNTGAKTAAALAVVVAGLVVWNVTLQLDTGGPSDLTAAQLNLIETISSGATILELTGTETAPNASAQLIHAQDGDRVFLILRNLPSLTSGEEFEIWAIREGVASSVGTFAKGAEGEQLVSFFADMSEAQAVGISIEPENGSPTGQPTGPIVLLGSL